MSFSVKCFRILIVSPPDVPRERMVAREMIQRWNDINALATGAVLLPVMWETHAMPTMGNRPQDVLNTQIVDG